MDSEASRLQVIREIQKVGRKVVKAAGNPITIVCVNGRGGEELYREADSRSLLDEPSGAYGRGGQDSE